MHKTTRILALLLLSSIGQSYGNQISEKSCGVVAELAGVLATVVDSCRSTGWSKDTCKLRFMQEQQKNSLSDMTIASSLNFIDDLWDKGFTTQEASNWVKEQCARIDEYLRKQGDGK